MNGFRKIFVFVTGEDDEKLVGESFIFMFYGIIIKIFRVSYISGVLIRSAYDDILGTVHRPAFGKKYLE